MSKKIIAFVVLSTCLTACSMEPESPPAIVVPDQKSVEQQMEKNVEAKAEEYHVAPELSDDFIQQYLDMDSFEELRERTLEGIWITQDQANMTKDEINLWEQVKNTVLIVKSKGESKEANVEFVFYDTSVLKGIIPKMKVKIRAHGENRKSEDGFGNAYYVKEFVGDKIEQQKRMLAPYVTNEAIDATGGYPRDTNVVLYIGTVRHVYCPTNELTILTIKIPNQDKSNQVEICCFASQAEAARNLKIGDAVAAAGYITSNTRSVNDRVEFRQSVVCRDISQIDGVLG